MLLVRDFVALINPNVEDDLLIELFKIFQFNSQEDAKNPKQTKPFQFKVII